MPATPPPPAPHVIVAGAGWAGLACALELTARGAQVTLLESARQAGGRARTVVWDELEVDNGQHLLVGAYRETLRLLTRVGLAAERLLLRRPLELTLVAPDGARTLRAAKLPAPFHLGVGLLTARGFGLSEKRALLRLTQRLRQPRYGLERPISVTALLTRDRQPAPLISGFWEPLCLAALNTPAESADAHHFLATLQETFAGPREASDLLFSRVPLGALLAEPALEQLQREGAEVRLGCRLHGFTPLAAGVEVQTDAGNFQADHLVLATPPAATRRLAEAVPELMPLAEQLAGLREDAPIATVYLRYPTAVSFGSEMLGLVGSLAQWLVDRGRICGQTGVIAVVMSGDGRHMELEKEALAEHIAAELAALFPHWPRPSASFVVREQRATFHCTVGVELHRPQQRTSHERIWLAGDYTASPLPATLEGAVRSGIECARLILP